MGQVLEGKGCLWFETGIFRSHFRFFSVLPPPRLGLLDSGPVSVARGRGPGISGREREGNSPTGGLSKRAIRMTFALGWEEWFSVFDSVSTNNGLAVAVEKARRGYLLVATARRVMGKGEKWEMVESEERTGTKQAGCARQ